MLLQPLSLVSHGIVLLVCKIKIVVILWYFKFPQNLVLSIRRWQEEYLCTPTNSKLYGENRSSGLETGQQKIDALAYDELHNSILNWSGEPIKLV